MVAAKPRSAGPVEYVSCVGSMYDICGATYWPRYECATSSERIKM